MTKVAAMSPEYVVLGLLNQQPAHGYELHQRLTEELGHIWHISMSQMYNVLKRLEAKGFIIGVVQPQEKAPARHRFRLTPLGRRRFEEWLSMSAEPRARAIRVEFLTRLYFIYLANPKAARTLIDDQLIATRAGLEHMTSILAELPPDQVFNQLGLDLRLRQLNSILEWLTECRTILGFES